MSGKTKKAPQLTLKEKRAAKREKNAPAEFIKPRKGAKELSGLDPVGASASFARCAHPGFQRNTRVMPLSVWVSWK